MSKCKHCGKSAGVMMNECDECLRRLDAEAREKVAAEKKRREDEARQIAIVQLTTAPVLDGHHVERTIDVITAECAFGMNVFRDFFAGVRDVFGGRSDSIQKVLRDARVTCLNELRKEAHRVGANAVIAVSLDYSEFSGGGTSMLFLVASGTAVEVSETRSPRAAKTVFLPSE